MAAPRYSVIIPLFNKEKYVERAILSVLRQTFFDYEIIVIDDGSTDKSVENVPLTKSGKIKLISQQNMGVSAARNEGIRQAEGNFVAFLDADDEWEPQFLETIEELIHCYPLAGAYCTAYDFSVDGRRVKNKFSHIPVSANYVLIPNYFKTSLYSRSPISTSSVCVKKDVFDEVGFFTVGAVTGEDIDMWIRIALKFNIAFSWRVGAVIYKDIDNNASKNYAAKKNYPFLKYLKNIKHLGNVDTRIIESLKKFIAKKQILAAKENIVATNHEVARDILISCDTNYFFVEKYLLLLLTYLPCSCARTIINLKIKIRKLIRNENNLFR